MVSPLVVFGAAVTIAAGILGALILPTCGNGWSLIFFGVAVIGGAIAVAGTGGAALAPYVVILGFLVIAVGLVVGHGATCTLP